MTGVKMNCFIYATISVIATGLSVFDFAAASIPSRPLDLNFKILQKNPPVVKVTWMPPNATNVKTLRYKLSWGSPGEHYKKIILDSEAFSYTTPGLENAKRYTFGISAGNLEGFGPEEFGILTTPEGAPSGRPQNIKAEATSENSVRITWHPPAEKLRNGIIIGYQVVFIKSIWDKEEPLNTSRTSLDFTDLETKTTYVYKIKAFNRNGAGPWSKWRVTPILSISPTTPSPPKTAASTMTTTLPTTPVNEPDDPDQPIDCIQGEFNCRHASSRAHIDGGTTCCFDERLIYYKSESSPGTRDGISSCLCIYTTPQGVSGSC